jgi:hypothetical protein
MGWRGLGLGGDCAGRRRGKEGREREMEKEKGLAFFLFLFFAFLCGFYD